MENSSRNSAQRLNVAPGSIGLSMRAGSSSKLQTINDYKMPEKKPTAGVGRRPSLTGQDEQRSSQGTVTASSPLMLNSYSSMYKNNV